MQTIVFVFQNDERFCQTTLVVTTNTQNTAGELDLLMSIRTKKLALYNTLSRQLSALHNVVSPILL